jgi:hypothetical protein
LLEFVARITESGELLAHPSRHRAADGDLLVDSGIKVVWLNAGLFRDELPTVTVYPHDPEKPHNRQPLNGHKLPRIKFPLEVLDGLVDSSNTQAFLKTAPYKTGSYSQYHIVISADDDATKLFKKSDEFEVINLMQWNAYLYRQTDGTWRCRSMSDNVVVNIAVVGDIELPDEFGVDTVLHTSFNETLAGKVGRLANAETLEAKAERRKAKAEPRKARAEALQERAIASTASAKASKAEARRSTAEARRLETKAELYKARAEAHRNSADVSTASAKASKAEARGYMDEADESKTRARRYEITAANFAKLAELARGVLEITIANPANLDADALGDHLANVAI